MDDTSVRWWLYILLGLLALGCRAKDDSKPQAPTDGAVPIVDVAPPAGPSLYDRLGGQAGIQGIVENFAAAAHSHPELAPYFMNANIDGARLGECLIRQLSAVTGGLDDRGRPILYPGNDARCRDMRTSHATMGVTFRLFDLTVGALVGELTAAGATQADLVAIGRVLRGLQDEIVSPADPEGRLITYHRLGGLNGREDATDPLIQGGIRGLVTAFVTTVAGDETINGFFTDLDEAKRVRFETCLSRQICGLTGGPCIYGAEVDGMPGVSAMEPCKDMVAAHRDLTDNMDRPITGNDFVRLVEILIDVLSEQGVEGTDIAAIVGAIGPTCRDISGDPTGCPGRPRPAADAGAE